MAEEKVDKKMSLIASHCFRTCSETGCTNHDSSLGSVFCIQMCFFHSHRNALFAGKQSISFLAECVFSKVDARSSRKSFTAILFCPVKQDLALFGAHFCIKNQNKLPKTNVLVGQFLLYRYLLNPI